MPVRLEKRPGQQFGLNLGLVKKGTNETLREAITRVNDLPGVAYAEPNYILNADVVPNDYNTTQLWGVAKIQPPQAWDLATGSADNDNGLVCVIETCIDYNHPDLAANMHLDPVLKQGWNAITDSIGVAVYMEVIASAALHYNQRPNPRF